MIMLPPDPVQEPLQRMREDLSVVLQGASGSWIVQLKDRDVFCIVDWSTNKACTATPVARLAAVDEQRVDRLIAERASNDCHYLRSGQWLWAHSDCPASSLEVDELIGRISRVSRFADRVLEARVWGQRPELPRRQAAGDTSQHNNLIA